MSNFNKFLIVLIVLIAVLVGGLGYYTYFVYNKEPEQPIKDEVVVFDTEKLRNEVTSTIGNFPYEILLQGTNYATQKLKEDYKIYMSFKQLDNGSYNTITDIYKDEKYKIDTTTLPGKDKEGKKYPNYTSTKVATNKIRLFAQKIGLTVAEIKKMDVTLWEDNDLITTKVDIIDGKLIKEKMTELFKTDNTELDTFKRATIDIEEGFKANIIYDKNLDKIFITYSVNASIGTIKVTKVIKTTKTTDTFSFNVILANIMKNETEQSLETKEGYKKIECAVEYCDIDDKTLYKYQDLLDKYEIVFTKIDDNYQFENIKKKDA